MGLEKELKFPVSDCRSLLPALEETAACIAPWYFESNLVLDTPERALFHRGELLRLRWGKGDKLTFKAPCPETGNSMIKVMEELETGVADLSVLTTILHRLGFTRELRYEKFRSKWTFGAALICLDILPFGHFVEIEGEEENIVETATVLGLSLDSARRANYHTLFQEYLLERGEEKQDSFVFWEAGKQYWVQELGV